MQSFSSFIDSLTDEEEGWKLEFKDCRGGLSKDVWPTICAFANTDGGLLVLGVDDSATLLGFDKGKASSLKKQLFVDGRNRKKINKEVFTDSDVTVLEVEKPGTYILTIRIAAVSKRERPIFLDGKLLGGTYIRRNEGDFVCTEHEVSRMIREASPKGNDSTPIEEFGLTAFSKDTIKRYRQRFSNLHPDHSFNDFEEFEFLKAIKAVDNKGQHPTIAGLLIFGTEPALRDWRQPHLIDYRKTPEHAGATTWDDRITWEGNLLEGYFKIFPRLTDDTPIPRVILDGERVDNTPAHKALREAFVNLLVHAGYTETAPSLIIKSPEGYLFRNPGDSRVNTGEMLTGNRSDPRNPNLLYMFRQIGLAEQAGSGIPNIIKNWKALGFQIPEIEQNTSHYEFVLKLKNVHLLTDEDRQWLKTLSRHKLTEPQQLALVCARHEGKVDNERLRKMTSLHPTDATSELREIAGLLEKRNDGRGAYYVLPRQTSLFDSPPILPENITEDAENITEEGLVALIRNRLSNGLKMKRNERRRFIEGQILELCRVRPHASRELAKIFNMAPPHIISNYLKPLLDAKKLKWTGSSKQDKTGKYQTY